LKQSKEMLKGRGVKTTDNQLAELYMILGGVPYYLSLLEKDKSIYQNIDSLLFERTGKLFNEYQNLLPSLFDDANNHLMVMEVLASKWKGVSRSEIASIYRKIDGGGLTKVLIDLEHSGFISTYVPFKNEKKDTLYRLSDGFALFYLKFLKRYKKASFFDLAKTVNYRIWCGYAFENLCLQHVPEIQKALGISKIKTASSSFLYRGTAHIDGFQLDLLIERADNVINVCEMKFHSAAFIIDKKYYQHIKKFLVRFQEIVGDKTIIHFTMISANGVVQNEYTRDLIDSEVVLSQLF
jgi:hypothetical protein